MSLPSTTLLPNPQESKSPRNADLGLDQLSYLMSQYGVDANNDTDISDLLKQLDTADGVANDVEGKLDDIIKNLDELLESLETEPGESDLISVFKPTPHPEIVKT